MLSALGSLLSAVVLTECDKLPTNRLCNKLAIVVEAHAMITGRLQSFFYTHLPHSSSTLKLEASNTMSDMLAPGECSPQACLGGDDTQHNRMLALATATAKVSDGTSNGQDWWHGPCCQTADMANNKLLT